MPVDSVKLDITVCVTDRTARGGGGIAHSGATMPDTAPHFEVLLDERPPVVRQALDPGGAVLHPELRFPVVVDAPTTLLLTPLTDEKEVVWWRFALTFVATTGRWKLETPSFPVTSDRAWLKFSPGGAEPERVRDPMAGAHWPLSPQ